MEKTLEPEAIQSQEKKEEREKDPQEKGGYLRGRLLSESKDVSLYLSISPTGRHADWIELHLEAKKTPQSISASSKVKEEEKEPPKEIIKKIEEHMHKKNQFHPKILKYFIEKRKLILITEPRGDKSLSSFLKDFPSLSVELIRTITGKIIDILSWMVSTGKKSGFSIDTITISLSGKIYIHKLSLWKELLSLPLQSDEEVKEEDLLHRAGVAFLCLGTGKYLYDISSKFSLSISDQEKNLIKKHIIECIMKIKIPCFRELVISAFESPFSLQLIEEMRSMHFFYPNASADPCTCSVLDSLHDQSPRPSSQLPIETLYDYKGGVAVKALLEEPEVFFFHMHFFKNPKRISFRFNGKEDTVDKVVKEMKEEQLVDNEQIELIKEHMEILIRKMKNTSQLGNQNLIKKEDPQESTAYSSEEEYPVTECKDSQQVLDFVLEVAHHVKRTKTIAETWNALLKQQEIQRVEDLRMLVEEDWQRLKLPIFSSRAMKNILFGESQKPFKENMMAINESLKEYENDSTVEELLLDVAQKHARIDLYNDWVQKVKCQDIRTVGELKQLKEEDWNHLDLSVFAQRAIRNAIFRTSRITPYALRPTHSVERDS
ncbi:WNK lysine deficient protein kinase [Nematocida sp. LUAm3]|nr:WNK lysine deficient protein kinase [Nematocida sp. LUAm3]KAI5173515.1 WNK lysine deficient protein kinase [Nematocida sp. LUAm2]KAI5176736.1 WNK lysine deficient protein kinase [Nematocida sp. LUAm1]